MSGYEADDSRSEGNCRGTVQDIDLRVRRDHVPYNLWEQQGVLMTTEGNVVHYGYIEKSLWERFRCFGL